VVERAVGSHDDLLCRQDQRRREPRMKPRNLLDWLVAAIAALTVVSGLTQMLAPRFVLGMIGGQATPTSAHFFGIIGMFMTLFGGALLNEVLGHSHQPIVPLWA